MSYRVRDITSETSGDEKIISKAMSFKGGIKFPLGGNTYATIRAGETQPTIEISAYEHFKTSQGDHVVIPKHRGAVLTPKQFTQLIKNGPLMRSVINAFTKEKRGSNSQRSMSDIRQVKRKTVSKVKVDPKTAPISLQPCRTPGRPLKRKQSCGSKKDVSTQTEAKKQCTATDVTGKNFTGKNESMKVFTGVQKTKDPFAC